MEDILLEILDELRRTDNLDSNFVEKVVRKHNKNRAAGKRPYAKKRLLPFYLAIKESEPARWQSWDVNSDIEKRLIQTLRVKPRRTASGVATITVITKPWKCASNCLYCPNDLRMPKSYLANEPACQRAERNYFDPYLQVTSRLRALTQMGHITDKIELIVLGGTWSDYPENYQIWFIKELFRALNDGTDAPKYAPKRKSLYQKAGIGNKEEALTKFVSETQRKVNKGLLTYNHAIDLLYEKSGGWRAVSNQQRATFDELQQQHTINENTQHRVVGLVIETRPDTITPKNLTLIRRLGCTKIQMGIQSLDSSILKVNKRNITVEKIQEAFELIRVFGFKIHAHFMTNLYTSTVDKDKRDFLKLVTEPAYLPDEIKLYPCALISGTKLCARWIQGTWRPYTEDELLDVLIEDTLATPPFTRISRMIRDFSAHDIVAGNKKVNLRQMVERKIADAKMPVSEIRYREISTNEPSVDTLKLDTIRYSTSATEEFFLQWITPEEKIVGFLRLSLPKSNYIDCHASKLPIGPHEAMIREIHIYGKVAGLHKTAGVQHLGLGKQLIEKACFLARSNEFTQLNVISSVGTRGYYRSLGFVDKELYQCKSLKSKNYEHPHSADAEVSKEHQG